MFFFCVSSSKNEEKKRKKKKEKGVGMGWATTQLCHNTMGNCIVTQQALRECRGWLLEEKVTIHVVVS